MTNPTNDQPAKLIKHWVLLRDYGFSDPFIAEVIVLSENLIGVYEKALEHGVATHYPIAVFCWNKHLLKASIANLNKKIARSRHLSKRGFLVLVLDRTDNTVVEIYVVSKTIRGACRAAIENRKADIGQSGKLGKDCGYTAAMVFDLVDLEALLSRLS